MSNVQHSWWSWYTTFNAASALAALPFASESLSSTSSNFTSSTSLAPASARVYTAAAAVALPAPVILGVSPTTGASSSLATVSAQVTLTGSAVAGSTVSIYSGTTVLGTVTAGAQGQWSYTTANTLTDGAHTFSATAASGGATSASSAAATVTVKAGIASFTALTDNWSNPITVGGLAYYVENANVSGNAPWAITEMNDHTLRFTLKPGDLWQDNGSNRTEISGDALYAANTTVNVSYQMTVQPGNIDPNLSWEIMGQMHADENSAIVGSLTADYPIYSVHLTGAGGYGGGDYLAIEGIYLPSGSNTPIDVPGTAANNGYLYVSSQPIIRGQSYAMQMQASFQDNAKGFLEVWINGVQVVDYHGPIGYGAANYWKEGVYEGDTTTQAVTVDYANTAVSAVPYAPVIASDVVNGNIATLGGTAEANSVVSIYDGSALLGSVKAAGSGIWSFQTPALASGAHSFTATAKDSAGKISPASLPNAISIAQVSSGAVTVANYLANTATLDASGAVTISDTATAVAAAIDTINADSYVSAITLLGTGSLNLSVAQTFGDTHALNAITNSTYGVSVTDTGANVAAQFDALNADSHIVSILPAGGSQNLALTLTQMLNDTRAISLLDPFIITVTDTAANLNALSTAQIAAFAAAGARQLVSSDADLTLTLAQRQALGTGGISVLQPFSGGTTEVVTYAASGNYASILHQGVTGQSYTSFTVTYGSNGRPASALYSNGMTETWAYNADGTYVTAFSGVTGQSYTSYTVTHASSGKPVSAVYSNGVTAAWTYNADGSYVIAVAGVTGQAYSSYTVNYGSNSKPVNAIYSNGMTETWNFNADRSSSIVFNGVTNASYTWREVMYNTTSSLIGSAVDATSGASSISLAIDGASVSSSSGALSVALGADTFALHPHARETINSVGLHSEIFNFGAGFGTDTVNGFTAGGSANDVLSLHLSMFNGLSSANTAAQNVALLLSGIAMAQSGANVKITDTSGDVLTLAGITTSTLTQYANSAFKFM